MRVHDSLHLTYCTNTHPSNGVTDVMRALDEYAVPLRARLSPTAPFGVGLRLSGEESRELLEPGRLEHFAQFLSERGLYVFTMNGFPYGSFHGESVKAQVHAPDWRTEERVQYTLRLADILAVLLPDGEEGGISTSPLSYKTWVDQHDPDVWQHLTEQVVRVVEHLAHLEERTERFIHLDIEPEPDGLLERSDELVTFFERHLLRHGAVVLSDRLGVTRDAAANLIARHVQVCLDTCHVAVAYERPADVIRRYLAAGMRIGKIQVSSALRVPLPREEGARREALGALAAFVEPTYLHQVLECDARGRVRQYPDLPDALREGPAPDASEWRVHFHVPVFWEGSTPLSSTQAAILETFECLREQPFTRHVEVETYTWDVLPRELKQPLLDSIERELKWVHDVLA